MGKFKLYFLNNKRIFIILGSLFSVIVCFLGCFFFYQYNQNRNVIEEVIFSDLENDINNENLDNEIEVENDKEDNSLEDKEINNTASQNQSEEIEYIYVDIKDMLINLVFIRL